MLPSGSTSTPRTRSSYSCLRRRCSKRQVVSTCAHGINALSRNDVAPSQLMNWLETHGVKNCHVAIRSTTIAERTIDRTVATTELKAGDTAFSIPSDLVVTLDRVFQNDTLAELLTTDKLSELACLALYMMYEKKNGRKSFWYCFIKELDRLRATGQQGAESPVLWPQAEAERLLQGSPVLNELKERIRGIDEEYVECDTVWYLAGSLFNAYPFDIPTECFSKETFRQAFAAIQATVVHLQNVPLSRRFALVPLGPPLLSYSSTSKAVLRMSEDNKRVELILDRSYVAGEPIVAWCGPQPNRRLFINYGIVDEANPYDFMQVTASIAKSDPLFQSKRTLLLQHGFAAQKQVFRLQRSGGFPLGFITFLRVAFVQEEESLSRADLMNPDKRYEPMDDVIFACLVQHLRRKLQKYRYTVEEDIQTLTDRCSSAREKVAANLLRIEKEILQKAIADILDRSDVESESAFPNISASDFSVELY